MKDFSELQRMSGRDRALFGIKGGARLGLYLGVVAGLVAIALNRAGSSQLPPVQFAVAVLAGITVGGIVLALLRPRIHSTLSAALVGAVSIYPTLLLMPIAVRGFAVIGVALVWAAVVSLLVGGLLGVMAWRGLTRSPHSDLAA